MNLALSTVWASDQASDPRQLTRRLLECGLRHLELEYRLSTPLLNGLVPLLRQEGLGVVSVHNYCPLPPGMDPSQASGDLFNLASLDRDERELAVRYTLATMELASELEAGAVVLHLGAVNGAADPPAIKEAAQAGRLNQRLKANLEARARQAPAHVDAVSFCLDRLLARAPALGVTLGLENRYHAFQLPNLAEARLLLERFAGGAVGYWHDVGHAHTQDLAGLETPQQWLAAFARDLVGCHLHDARGHEDHLMPGQGEFDWAALARDLLACPLKVLEVHPGPGPEEMAQAAAMVAGHFDQAQCERDQKERA